MNVRASKLFFLLFALLAGCSTFDGLELDEPDAAARPLAASCAHATPSLPSPLPSGQGEHEFVVAVRSMDFGEGAPSASPEAANIGFDLDGKCTGHGEAASCRRPKWADAHADGTDGRDNTLGLVLASWSGAGKAPAAKQNMDNANDGSVTTVLRVRGYSGTSIDGDVQVEWFAATRSPDPVGGAKNPALWDGTDVWKPHVEWTVPPDDPDGGMPVVAKYQSDRAYVTDDVLVAHFALVRGALSYDFSNAWLQARLVDAAGSEGPLRETGSSEPPMEGRWSLREGIFAGRLGIDNWLASAAYTSDWATGKLNCTDLPGYLAEKKAACALADIRLGADDPAEACDAVSWAWRFEADPALLSDEVDPTRAVDYPHCPPEVSPANDNCASLE